VLDFGEDANGNGLLDVDPFRKGYQNGIIDNHDGYSKITGQVLLAQSASASSVDQRQRLGQDHQRLHAGGVAPLETGQQTVKFGASGNDLLDLDPANFEQAAEAFRNKTGSTMGTTVRGAAASRTRRSSDRHAVLVPYPATTCGDDRRRHEAALHEVILKTDVRRRQRRARLRQGQGHQRPADVRHSTSTARSVRTSWQATYRRPVFYGITFKNVRIPKGINGLFENCKFEGVTFVRWSGTSPTPPGRSRPAPATAGPGRRR
jgi:hypothetical protein